MKKETIFTLLVLVGGGFAVYQNWDVISEKLGLSEYSLGRIHAIDLTKNAYTLDDYRTNLEVITTHLNTSTREVELGSWQADQKGGGIYLVRYDFKVEGKPDGYHFSVNLNTFEVERVKREVAGEPEPPR